MLIYHKIIVVAINFTENNMQSFNTKFIFFISNKVCIYMLYVIFLFIIFKGVKYGLY